MLLYNNIISTFEIIMVVIEDAYAVPIHIHTLSGTYSLPVTFQFHTTHSGDDNMLIDCHQVLIKKR